MATISTVATNSESTLLFAYFFWLIIIIKLNKQVLDFSSKEISFDV